MTRPDAKMTTAHEYVVCRRELFANMKRFFGFGFRRPDVDTERFAAFVAGWEAAMRIRYEELLDENTALHTELIERDIAEGRIERDAG